MASRIIAILTCLVLLTTGCSERSSEVDPNLFIAQSLEGRQAQTSAHSATWHLGEEEDWAADMEAGKIVFTFANGTTATADIQIIGTYNTDDGTWLWGWDHPSVSESLGQHAKLAKAFGEEHGLAEYTNRKIECSEDDGWEFTAVAGRLGNANGAYRGPAGNTLVFMTFGPVNLKKR